MSGVQSDSIDFNQYNYDDSLDNRGQQENKAQAQNKNQGYGNKANNMKSNIIQG